MILLDTNVISEPLRAKADAGVVAWIDAQPVETLCLAAISLAELRFGVAALPAGKRRDVLHERIEKSIVPLFLGRILPFDEAAARAYGEIMAGARMKGFSIGMADGLIAATAAANGLVVATRDTTPFEAAGLAVVNPWSAGLA